MKHKIEKIKENLIQGRSKCTKVELREILGKQP